MFHVSYANERTKDSAFNQNYCCDPLMHSNSSIPSLQSNSIFFFFESLALDILHNSLRNLHRNFDTILFCQRKVLCQVLV